MPDQTVERLQGYLTHFGRKYPKVWRALEDQHLRRRAYGVDWPKECFVTVDAAASVLQTEVARLAVQQGTWSAMDSTALAGLAAWRPSQGIYRFDETLLEEVWSASVRALPVELIVQIPAWCVYIEAKPGVTWLDAPLFGVFMHLDYDVRQDRKMLRLLFDQGNVDRMMAFPIALGEGTLEAGIEAMDAQSRTKLGEPHPVVVKETAYLKQHVIEPMVSCLVYLCARNADYIRPDYPSVTRLKGGGRAIFPAEKAEVVEVGRTLGHRIREMREKVRYEGEGQTVQTGRKVQPHMRGPHYQTYWHGSEAEGTRHPVVQLKLPFMVGLSGEDDQDIPGPAVIHKVKPGK